MTHSYKESIKPFLHDEVVSTVERLKLTQEQAAEILGIEPRTYAYFKAGKTTFSATTLLMYLSRLCNNYVEFFDGLKKLIDTIEEY